MKRNSSRIAARGGSYSMAVTALAAAIAVAVNVLASVLPASATIDGTPTAYVTRTQTVDLIEAINQIILDG